MERIIDELVNRIDTDDSPTERQVVFALKHDALYELQKLDGEAFVNSAAALIKCFPDY